jgi:hypothetical protein
MGPYIFHDEWVKMGSLDERYLLGAKEIFTK